MKNKLLSIFVLLFPIFVYANIPHLIQKTIGNANPTPDPLYTIASTNNATSSNIIKNQININPYNGKKIEIIPQFNIPLNDNLTFHLIYYNDLSKKPDTITGSIMAGDFSPMDDAGLDHNGLVGCETGNTISIPLYNGRFSRISLNNSGGISNSHIYSRTSYNNNDSTYGWNNIFFLPNGEKIAISSTYPNGYPLTYSTTITSPHGISQIHYIYTISDQDGGAIAQSIQVSNIYSLNYSIDVQSGGACLCGYMPGGHECSEAPGCRVKTWHKVISGARDSLSNSWSNFESYPTYIPNRTSGIYTTPIDKPNGQKYTYASNSITYGGTNVATPEKVTYSKSGNVSTITDTDGSKTLYTWLPETSAGSIIPKNQKGLYSKLVKEDKNGKIFYEEDNTYGIQKGYVPVIITKVIKKDGLTTTTENSDFNDFMYPQTIVKTLSDGTKTTTKSTYFVLDNPTKGWHMIKPESIVTTDQSGKILNKMNNVYNSDDGTLTSSTVNGETTSYTYDNLYNVASITYPNGSKVQYKNYTNGKPQTVIDPNGNQVNYTYDLTGHILSKTDVKSGNVTTYNYDGLGYITKITPPQGNPTTFTYANNHLTITKTTGSHAVISNYDALGHLVNKTDRDTQANKNIFQKIITNPLNNTIFKSYPCADLSLCNIGELTTHDILDRNINITQNTTYN
jgi:YD repeat-containing protein